MATPEYAEKLYSQALPFESPEQQPVQIPETPPLKEPQKRKSTFTKIEKAIMGTICLAAVVLFFGSLLTQVVLSNQNRDLQDLQNDTSAMVMENTNLEQEVQELSRYNRVMEIAKELGLEMDEANVRNVTK